MGKSEHGVRRRRDGWVAVTLVLCAALVGFWEVMSNRSRRSFDPFAITALDFADFVPKSEGWEAKSRPVTVSAVEPNIFAYEMQRAKSRGQGAERGGEARPVLVRLVHGYNMHDCMRLKGYEVQLTVDTRNEGTNVQPRKAGQASNSSRHGGTSNIQRPTKEAKPDRYQLWRLVSETGDVSIWTTTMLRAGDLSETSVDCRSMVFPRIGLPDDPRWVPEGVTVRSLRHPVRNLRMLLRAKWNNSRRDVATFLRLKRPAWASDELLTLVALSGGGPVQPDEEAEVAREVLAAHGFLLSELQAWKQRKIAEPE